MNMTDFGNSYMTWAAPHDSTDTRKPGHMPWGNSARILIDARCTIIDDASGKREEIYLIAPCRTEWMYREEGLFQNPSGEYRVIFTQDRQLFVGKRIVEEGPRAASGSTSWFTSLDFTIRHYDTATPLPTNEAIVAATQQFLPINAVTELHNQQKNLRAILEYPIRTMNFHPDRQRFQVDTGPVIFPDLAADVDHWIDMCSLAHVAYNTLSGAEFILKCPTPLHDDGTGDQIFHYSDYRTLPAKHTFLGAGGLA